MILLWFFRGEIWGWWSLLRCQLYLLYFYFIHNFRMGLTVSRIGSLVANDFSSLSSWVLLKFQMLAVTILMWNRCKLSWNNTFWMIIFTIYAFYCAWFLVFSLKFRFLLWLRWNGSYRFSLRLLIKIIFSLMFANPINYLLFVVQSKFDSIFLWKWWQNVTIWMGTWSCCLSSNFGLDTFLFFLWNPWQINTSFFD